MTLATTQHLHGEDDEYYEDDEVGHGDGDVVDDMCRVISQAISKPELCGASIKSYRKSSSCRWQFRKLGASHDVRQRKVCTRVPPRMSYIKQGRTGSGGVGGARVAPS